MGYLATPALNNVDLVALAGGRVIVAASDRSDLATAHITLAELDTATGTLAFHSRIAVSPGEGYGICLSPPDKAGAFSVYSAPKNGIIYQTRIAGMGDLGTTPDHTTTTLTTEPSQPEGTEGGYLVASSQGDNAYGVYRLPGHEPVGRFRIAAGEFGSVEETDGIDLDPRPFGLAFPAGLFIAQDGMNAPAAQNFKLVRWDEILASVERGPAATAAD